MTEATSRRGVLLAAAGLGAVVWRRRPVLKQKGATSKATEIVLPPATDAISEFKLSIPSRRARRPEDPARHDPLANKETVGDWSQGVPLEKMKAFADYWGTTSTCAAWSSG